MADWQLFGESFFNVIQFSIWGILIGGVYALVALGIIIINKASGVFNFAQGYMMLIGGLFFWQFFNSAPSTGMVFGISGVMTLLILGILASLGFSFSFAGRRSAAESDERNSTNPAQSPVVRWLDKQVKAKRLQLYMLLATLIWFGLGYWFIQEKPDSLVVYITSAVAITLLVVAFMWLKSAETTAGTDARQASDSKGTLIGVGIGIVVWLIMGYIFLQPGREIILRGAVGGFVASVLIGLMIERFAIRPLLGQPVLSAILMTLAVGFVLQGMIQMIWGPLDRPLPIFVEKAQVTRIAVPGAFDANGNPMYIENTTPGKTLPDYVIKTGDWLGEDLRLRRNLTWGFGVALATFIGFVVLFRYTSIGLAMRATSENQTLAESVGLRVRLILAIAWATVAVMATIAGVIQGTGPGGLSKDVIPALALRVFPAVLLGGLDSVTGALVGGILIGVIESLSSLYISTTAAQEMMPFLVLIIVLMFRPDGLFGQRRIERV